MAAKLRFAKHAKVRTLKPRFPNRAGLAQFVSRFMTHLHGKVMIGVPRLEQHQAAELASKICADFSFLGPKGLHWTWDTEVDRPYPANMYGLNRVHL